MGIIAFQIKCAYGTEDQSAGKEAAMAIAVVGAGVFGCALAACYRTKGGDCTIVARSPEKRAALGAQANLRGAQILLQDVDAFDPHSYEFVILAVPAQELRRALKWLVPLAQNRPLRVVNAAKGIERGSLLLPHQILSEALPAGSLVASLSGPSFAKELAEGKNTSVVLASTNAEYAQKVCGILHTAAFRAYANDDIIGVEICGALKNVIALATGAVDGLEMGLNARAALLTRGMGEIVQVGLSLGAKPLTFLGLSGLGDLILTCTGELSRNRRLGFSMAQSHKGKEFLDMNLKSPSQEEDEALVEGVATAASAFQLSQQRGLETPIIDAVYRVLYEGVPLEKAVAGLLSRSGKDEFHWTKRT